MTEADTKDRILDAAEDLFAEIGFGPTSVRAITARAGVNLAAVHYHFQSKDALIAAVFERRLTPLNAERIRLLDQAIVEAGDGPLPLDRVIDAFLRPFFNLDAGRESSRFGRIAGRMFSEPGDFMKRVFDRHVHEVANRFFAAFRRAVPGLPEEDLLWRIHFLIGLACHTMAAAGFLEAISNGLCRPRDRERTLRHIVTFAVAGWRAAPLTESSCGMSSSSF